MSEVRKAPSAQSRYRRAALKVSCLFTGFAAPSLFEPARTGIVNHFGGPDVLAPSNPQSFAAMAKRITQPGATGGGLSGRDVLRIRKILGQEA